MIALLALEAAALGGSRNASAVAGIATTTVEYMTLLTRGCAGISCGLVVAVGDPPRLQRESGGAARERRDAYCQASEPLG